MDSGLLEVLQEVRQRDAETTSAGCRHQVMTADV